MSNPVRDRIGSLASRLRARLGRAFGTCRTCGKPTGSHTVGSGVQCHVCHTNGRRVVATDGGTTTATPDWKGLLEAARGYLVVAGELEEGDSVPRGELGEQLQANGYGADRDDPDPREMVDLAVGRGDLIETDDGGLRVPDDDSEHDAETGESVDPGDAEPGQADSEDASPGCETANPERSDLSEAAHAAFADGIEFFNSQLNRKLPVDYADTPRDYYENCREWSSETIEEKQLGYAPANCADRLVDWLHRQGHDREAIQASGLFYEDENNTGFTSHFSGRYVLPYFDRDGEPVYAISRSLDEDSGGHPGDHHGDQKYTKAVKGKDYSLIDEPIYGAETVTDDTDRLLVVGGIADAITLHQAGYSCISPVTTVRFKSRHESRVVDLVERHDIEGVYMVNDAERPSVDMTELGDDETADRIRDVLTISQFGEGLRAAFGNSEFLLEADIDPFLVTLPGGDDDLRKVDPDDFLCDNWGSVETILASARHAEDHPGYQEWHEDRQARALESAASVSQDTSSGSASGDSSQLFSLEFTDVASLSVGDRVDNPLGHHGDSHGYFVVIEKSREEFGYDHKYNVAYNALTYLLCDAGERRDDEPNGRLDDSEIFVAWKHAKANRCIPSDDAIPTRALHHIAETATDWDGETVERETHDGDTFDALPVDVYNAALETIQNKHGVDPGRELLTNGTDAEPVAALPLERLDEMDLQEARRFASKRGVDWPTTRETREALRSDIFETMHHGDTRLHDAPTGLGKSYAIASEPWLMRSDTTGEAPVIQLSETTKARDQAANDSEEAGVSHRRLLGRTEACPVAGGEHDPVDDEEDDSEDIQEPDTVVTIDGEPASEWLETMCNRRGLPLSVAHKYLDNNNDQDITLPCCDGSECHSVAQWDDLPRNDDGEATVDVIHATHAFAHVPSIRNGTNLVFDERPNFIEDLSHGRIREAVTAYLSEAGAPVSTFEQMVTRALEGDDTRNEHAEHAYISQALDHDPGREWYLEADGAHTLAPALARAIYYALLPGDDGDQQDANGRYSATVPHEPPRLDKDAHDSDGWNRTYVTVVMDDTLTVRYARNTPNLSGARSVIGLDAHPEVTLWQQNVHPDIRISPVLGPTRRALWKRYERGLLVVGVGDATRPLTSGEFFDEDGTRAFLGALREQFGERFSTGITAQSVESKTRRILEEVGVDDPETMHYGEEKSRGDFGDQDIGALNGCIDPGDGYVLDRLAEAGLDATPETTTDDDGAERRAHGRGFVGPDAEAADSLLESVRAQHTAQGAGRYARNADDPDDRAIVFVRTDAAPTGFVDIQVPGVEWLATDKQQTIVDALRESSQATARELAETTGLSKEHVRTTLQRLEADDVVSVREEAGDHGAHLYRALAGLESGDVVDLTPQTANDDVTEYYTWSLAISQPTPAGTVTIDDEPPRPESSPQASPGETGSEPPP